MPLKLWAQFVGIDVEKEMVHGECLSSPQIEDFKSFIPLYVNDLRSLLIAPPVKLNDWLSARETVSDSELRSRRLHNRHVPEIFGRTWERCAAQLWA